MNTQKTKRKGGIIFDMFLFAVLASIFMISMKTSAQGAEPVQVLFVANGYYQQETDIADHLTDLGVYDVTIVEDNQVTGSTDLSTYDLLIITEFAPGISYTGLQNIESSGKPVLIVEYWDFWYSYKLGLVEDDWAGYYGTDTVDVMDDQHPITYWFDDSIQVYSSVYTIYGIPFNDIKSGVTPLVYSSASYNEVAVISDDARKIVATGIYDTTRYTVDGWRLFDGILSYLYPIGEETSNPDEINKALAASGVLELLEQISDSPSQWTYETASAAIWFGLFTNNISFLYDGFMRLLPQLLNGSKKFEVTIPPGSDTWQSFLFFDSDYVSECKQWEEDLRNNVGDVMPVRLGYVTTQVNMVPQLYFMPSANSLTGIAKYFKITLHSFLKVYNPFTHDFITMHGETASSNLLTKNDLYPGYDLSYYWWGTLSEPWEPSYSYKTPMEMFPEWYYKTYLDFYNYDETKPLRSGEEKCIARFNYMSLEDDLQTFILDEDPLTYMECPRYSGNFGGNPIDDPFIDNFCAGTGPFFWSCECNVSKQLYYVGVSRFFHHNLSPAAV